MYFFTWNSLNILVITIQFFVKKNLSSNPLATWQLYSWKGFDRFFSTEAASLETNKLYERCSVNGSAVVEHINKHCSRGQCWQFWNKTMKGNVFRAKLLVTWNPIGPEPRGSPTTFPGKVERGRWVTYEEVTPTCRVGGITRCFYSDSAQLRAYRPFRIWVKINFEFSFSRVMCLRWVQVAGRFISS